MNTLTNEKKCDAGAEGQGEKRLLSIDDLFRIKLINSPEISPCGGKILFSYKWTDLKENTYHSNIYLADLGDGALRPFTYGEHNDSYPLWSPDGSHVIFRSDRDKKKGLWMMPAHGGEAVPLMTEKGSLGEYIWSNDSTRVFYTYREQDSPVRLTHVSNDPDYKQKDEDRPYNIIEDIPYKTKGGDIKPSGKFHLYSIDISTKEIITLTEGDRDDGGMALSPDGKTMAFVSGRESDPIHEYERNDLYLLDLATMKATLLATPYGSKAGLEWSDDGSYIYFSGHIGEKGKCGVEDLRLYRVPSGGGGTELLTKDFDGYVSNMLIGDTREFDDLVQQPLFIDGGRKMIFCASRQGGCHLYEVPSDGGVPVRIEQDAKHDVSYYSMDRNKENMAVLRGDMLSPGEIYHYRRSGDRWEIKRITSYNEFLKEETKVTEPRELWFTTKEGVKLQGWLLTPPGFDEKKKYPLVHQIHGGPHILYGYTFFHEMQLMAARGYCVLFINPRGSRGYGTAFTAAVEGYWGGPDTVDQMEFLDHVQGLGFIDESNLFLTGGSYGGYMTNWLVTQTGRYCAAASHRSIVNLVSTFGMSCGAFHFEQAFGGVPWRDYTRMMKHSPLFHVEKVTTPLLIMHSENDNLTPLGEAEQFFVALRYLGKKVRFVRFRNETHELSRGGRPTNRRARLELVMEWFEAHRK
ncbi:MAG: S9 family peptidase [Candidatus Eremiobacteraeota bacterium]|nr:S9 family peptidase [Candidatus Eremiobacteraeota bacterium]